MQRTKKLISIFAAITMIFSMLAMTVNAENTGLNGGGLRKTLISFRPLMT